MTKTSEKLLLLNGKEADGKKVSYEEGKFPAAMNLPFTDRASLICYATRLRHTV